MAEDVAGKTVQVLDLMLKFFARECHWSKIAYQHGNRRCLVGAAMHFSARLELPPEPVMSLLEAALPRRQIGLISFNDHHCRDIDELRTVIGKARSFALENTEHERAAAALRRRFLAELEQERHARTAAGDTRETNVLCPDPPERTPVVPQRRAA